MRRPLRECGLCRSQKVSNTQRGVPLVKTALLVFFLNLLYRCQTMKPVSMTIVVLLIASRAFAADPLPSWNDGAAEITAINILLQLDATMFEHSAVNNARLLKVFPKGFPLDTSHTPHITMLQCFVRTADLEKVYVSQEKVLATANVNAMKLEAFKYYYAPGGPLGVAGICARPTPDIIKLQADIIAAAKPFMVNTRPDRCFHHPA